MITGQIVKNTYQGDGVNREFTITFDFTDSSQIKFKVNGEEVTTNYSLNTVAKTLTYPTVASELDPLTSTDKIEIYRDTEISQDIEFNNGGPLNANMIEYGLDKLTMIAQEILNIAKNSGLEAGKGIDIEDGVISVKGAKVMPDGTDIDTLKEEGVYLISNPTSTKGMPTEPNLNVSISGSYAIVRVIVPQIDKGTYFVYQEMTMWYIFSGVSSVSEPLVSVRTLTDYTYMQGYHFWKSIGNEIKTISKYGTTATLSDTNRGTQIIMNPAGYGSAKPSTAITSLTITNYTNILLGKARIIFKAGNGFTLTIQGVGDYWLGTKPTTWTEGQIYAITMEAGFLKCEEVTM